MRNIQDYIKYAADSEKPGRLKIQEIKISFDAPPKTAIDTLNIKNNKQFEANFQWLKYAVILSDEKETKWYTYIITLEPWGIRSASTPVDLHMSDHLGAELKDVDVDITPKEIDRMYDAILRKPNLDPDLPVSMVTYLNSNPKDSQKKYTPVQFKETFEKSLTENNTHFYILISKTNELKTPLGEEVPEGKVAPVTEQTKESSMHDHFRNIVRSAKKIKPESGGFSIVRDLFYKQHKEQAKKK